MPDPRTDLIVLSNEEAAELYLFTQHSFVNANALPCLSALLARVAVRVSVTHPGLAGPCRLQWGPSPKSAGVA